MYLCEANCGQNVRVYGCKYCPNCYDDYSYPNDKTDNWQPNIGTKPLVEFVDVLFMNCDSLDTALTEKKVFNIHVDELEWQLDQNGAEPTHFRPTIKELVI